MADVVSQLIVSVDLDHFGLSGRERHPASMTRLVGCVGCAGLVVSLLLLQKS